jgi:hypothetical protein
MKDNQPFHRFAETSTQPKRKDICANPSQEVYKSVLKTMYAGKINTACTCKLSRFENDGIKEYSFNDAKLRLLQWMTESNNQEWYKELFDTFQKCNCSMINMD